MYARQKTTTGLPYLSIPLELFNIVAELLMHMAPAITRILHSYWFTCNIHSRVVSYDFAEMKAIKADLSD